MVEDTWCPDGIEKTKKYIMDKNRYTDARGMKRARCMVNPDQIKLDIDFVATGEEPFIQFKLLNIRELAEQGCDVAEFYRMQNKPCFKGKK